MIYNGTRLPDSSSQFAQIKKFIEGIRPNPETKLFLHIGRLEPQKNQLMLVTAFQQLVADNSNAILIMIGGERRTPEAQEIATKVKMASEKDNIFWVGGGQPAMDYLLLSDYFCLSSKYEGMPISLIEALAAGCIPVCTPVGGIPEILEKTKAIISKDITTESYFQALKTAYNYETDVLEAGKKEFMELFQNTFSISICSDKYLSVYHHLIKKIHA